MITFPERTPAGKVVLYCKETGQPMERWPVDARELLATGAYTTDQASLNAVTADDGGAAVSRADNEATNAAGAPQGADASDAQADGMDADALLQAEGVTAGIEYPDPIPTTGRAGRGRQSKRGR